MDFSFILTFFEKLASLAQTLWTWFSSSFNVLGQGTFSILGLLGGVGLVVLIIYSVVKF